MSAFDYYLLPLSSPYFTFFLSSFRSLFIFPFLTLAKSLAVTPMNVHRNFLIFSRLVHLVEDTVLGMVSDNGSNTSATSHQVQTGNCPAAWSRYLTAIITPRRDTKPDKKTASGRETLESRFQHKLDDQQLPTDSGSQLRFLHEYYEYDRHVEQRHWQRQHRQQRRFEARVSRVRDAVCQQRELRARWEVS